MGCYINPPHQAKEIWLAHNALEELTEGQVRGRKWTEDPLVVCLVDNGAFSAAGIAFSLNELQIFLSRDHRPKLWFLVERKKLNPYLGRF